MAQKGFSSTESRVTALAMKERVAGCVVNTWLCSPRLHQHAGVALHEHISLQEYYRLSSVLIIFSKNNAKGVLFRPDSCSITPFHTCQFKWCRKYVLS